MFPHTHISGTDLTAKRRRRRSKKEDEEKRLTDCGRIGGLKGNHSDEEEEEE